MSDLAHCAVDSIRFPKFLAKMLLKLCMLTQINENKLFLSQVATKDFKVWYSFSNVKNFADESD